MQHSARRLLGVLSIAFDTYHADLRRHVAGRTSVDTPTGASKHGSSAQLQVYQICQRFDFDGGGACSGCPYFIHLLVALLSILTGSRAAWVYIAGWYSVQHGDGAPNLPSLAAGRCNLFRNGWH